MLPAANVPIRQKHDPKIEEVERRLVQLMQRTGNPIIQENGQRIYGPHKKLQGMTPPKGSEIFIGKLPTFIFEDELVPLCEKVGTVYQFRLMMDFSGRNRGYAFVTYTSPQEADRAMLTLNSFKLRNRYSICVYKSMDNCRLFVGGIPHDKKIGEIWEKLQEYVQGIVNIIMYPSNIPGEFNRGYVFAEFECHRRAALARRQLGAGMNIMLWQNESPIAVDWADPLPDVDPYIMQTVTKLYLRNLNVQLTTGQLQYNLTKFINLSTVIRVHKISDFAFVHFSHRDHAERAFRQLNGAMIAGKAVEVSWARPKCYSKEGRMNLPPPNFCSSVPPKMRRLIEQRKTLLTLPGWTSPNQNSHGSSSSGGSPESVRQAFGNFDRGASFDTTFYCHE